MFEKIMKLFGYAKEKTQPEEKKDPTRIYFNVGNDIKEEVYREIGLMPFEGQINNPLCESKYLVLEDLEFVPRVGDVLTIKYHEFYVSMKVEKVEYFIGLHRFITIDTSTVEVQDAMYNTVYRKN